MAKMVATMDSAPATINALPQIAPSVDALPEAASIFPPNRDAATENVAMAHSVVCKAAATHPKLLAWTNESQLKKQMLIAAATAIHAKMGKVVRLRKIACPKFA